MNLVVQGLLEAYRGWKEKNALTPAVIYLDKDRKETLYRYCADMVHGQGDNAVAVPEEFVWMDMRVKEVVSESYVGFGL